MRIKSEDITSLKLRLSAEVDEGAEALRGSIITLGPGQALVYEQKMREAELVMANTTFENDEYVTSISQYEVPNLSVEAADLQISLYDAAMTIIYNAALWSNISAIIEQARLSAKRAIRDAVTASEARAAAQVNWSTLL